jgi:delta-1-pyrroline-5-carboxylate synthetase
MAAQNIGTMFSPLEISGANVEGLAKQARQGSRRMASLRPEQRADVIRHLAGSLLTNNREILDANMKDLEVAQAKGLSGPMYDRLILTQAKLEDLAMGLNQIADSSITNVGRVIRRTQISSSLEVVQKTVPIGVLMVIFESRPDALPQVCTIYSLPLLPHPVPSRWPPSLSPQPTGC